MAENGLLSNQNLDKIFGITPSPAQSLLGDNFNSQKNVATFAPFLAPIMQQGFTPEALLKGFVGAGAARQGVEDRATKNYMTQQDILTQTLNARKTQGDIAQQPYDLIKKRFEAEAAPYNLGDTKNTFYKSSFFIQGIKDEIKKLEDSGNTDQVNFIKTNPNEYFKRIGETDYRTNKMPDGYNAAAKSIGLDPNNRAKWTQQDWIDLDILVKSADTVEAQAKNLATRQANQLNPRGIPLEKILNRNEQRNAIINRKIKDKQNISNNGKLSDTNQTGTVNLTEQKELEELSNQNVYAGEDLQFYQPSRSELQKGMIPKGNTKFPDGAVFAPTGQNYTKDEWDGLGSERQFALKPTRLPEDATDREGQVNEQAKINGNKHSYLYSQIDKNNKVISEILSKPQFLRDMTSVGGSFLINTDLGKYGFTSNVQDIMNLFDVNKNQQFIKAIQDMRANNDTGGAVGNVSNFEVQMFMNAAGAFQRGSSSEQLYSELIKMRDAGTETMNFNRNKYIGLYGQNDAERTGMMNYNPDLYDKGEPRTLKEALEAAGISSYEAKAGQARIDQNQKARRDSLIKQGVITR